MTALRASGSTSRPRPDRLIRFYSRSNFRGDSSGPTRSSGGVTRGLDPDFRKFDRALKTQMRPVLVSLQRLPFRDFTAEEFLGRTLTIGAGGCVSVFQGSSLTLGQMADACVYVGAGADVDSKAKRL